MSEIVYFELNNWFAEQHYPAREPFLGWMGNDLRIQFSNERWVVENKLCVVKSLVDMSVNFCITATKNGLNRIAHVFSQSLINSYDIQTNMAMFMANLVMNF